MTQVNLQEIAKKWFGDTLSVGALEIIKMAMRESCEQTIGLCSENASKICAGNSDYRWDQFENYKQAILNTKKQIV